MPTGFDVYTHDAGVQHFNTLTLKCNEDGTRVVTLMTKDDALEDAPLTPVDGNISVMDNRVLGGRTVVSNGSNGGNIYIASTIHANVAGGSGNGGGSNGPAYGGGGAGAGGSNGASGTIVTNFAAEPKPGVWSV